MRIKERVRRECVCVCACVCVKRRLKRVKGEINALRSFGVLSQLQEGSWNNIPGARWCEISFALFYHF